MKNLAYTLLGLTWITSKWIAIAGGIYLVILILSPMHMAGSMADATDNSVRQSLNVIRDAVEAYAAQNDRAYPPGTTEATFKAALQPYLRGSFPSSVVGTEDATVAMSAAEPLVADDTTGWMYNSTTGEFIINCTETSEDGSTRYDEF